nr:MFS transporter [Actinacidiphila yeochonensis]
MLAPMMLGSILNPVNSSIIAVALVPIGAAFGAPPSQTAWLISALYLATSIGQPVVGRLIDLFGPRRLFLAGTALTGVAGVVGVLAPDLGVLIAARVLLGFGTCAGYPAAMNLIRSEARRTGQDSPAGVLTALAVTTQTISVIGPSLGGLLIGLGGWRATMAVNVPLAAAGLLLGALRLPRTEPAERGKRGERADGGEGAERARGGAVAQLDLPGMGFFAATLVSLLLFLMHPAADRWYLPVVTVLAAAAFTRRELGSPQPFIDLRVLGGNVPLLVTYTRALLAYVVSYAVLFGFTQWLEEGRGLTASKAGLALLPLFLTGIAVSTATGRRAGVRGKFLVGAAGQIVACVMMLFLGAHSSVWLLVAVAAVFGVPQGLNSLALQNSVYFQADPERLGSSAGLLRTFGYLGAITASTANSAVYRHRADTAGMHRLALVMLAAGALFLLVTVFDRGLGRIGAPARPARSVPPTQPSSQAPSAGEERQQPGQEPEPPRGP